MKKREKEWKHATQAKKNYILQKCHPAHSYYCMYKQCEYSLKLKLEVKKTQTPTFDVQTDVDACDYTQGLYGHCKSLQRKLTLGEKSLATWGT